MKELKVGERVTITLIVAKSRGCSGCFFNNNRCVSSALGLSCILPDGTSIIFKEVKEQRMGEVKNEILGIAIWIFLAVYFLICGVIAAYLCSYFSPDWYKRYKKLEK